MKIHYIWLQGESNLPNKYKKNIEKTKEIYKDATVKIWSKKDILNLIHEKYPKLSKIIKVRKHWIQLVDIGRIAILDAEGGLYLDTDILLKKKFCFQEDKLYFVKSKKGFQQNLRNWLIHSPPNQYLWKKYIENLSFFRSAHHFWCYYVAASTGGVYITNLVKKYKIRYELIFEEELGEKYLHNSYDSSWHGFFCDDRDFILISLLLLIGIFAVFRTQNILLYLGLFLLLVSFILIYS